MARRRTEAMEIQTQAESWATAAMDLYRALAEHARCGSYCVVVEWHEGRPRVIRAVPRGVEQ